MAIVRFLSALVAGSALVLSGCNSLLGDFKYDPNATGKGGNGSGGAGMQGDIVVMPEAGLVTTEQGGKATFTIVLKRKPTAPVAIALSSSDAAEGLVSPVSVVFTELNFAAPQTVQVIGVNDDLEDKNKIYRVITSPASSDDKSYNGFDPLDPQVTNIDDESAGFILTPPSGLVTTESGGEATFTIALTRAPVADVTVPLSSDNLNEGTVSPETLVFTPVNWMAPQTVTVTGVNDDAADGARKYHIVTGTARSDDPAYMRLDPDDEEVTNQDNDTAGVTLNPQSGLVTFESGAMTSFGIVLNSPPSADVTIALTSSDEAEGTVSPSSVTFTPVNWMAPQSITVTGVNDDRADGNQPYLVSTSIPQSDDAGYAGLLDPPAASITNIDNDSPGLTVTPTFGLVTSEAGSMTEFSVALNSKPNGDVLLDVSSSRPEEGVATPVLLAFTEQNWNAPQVVTVSGQDDEVQDGMQTYTVHVTPNPTSADPAYATLLEVDVALSNTDDDSAGITVMTTGTLATAERGDSTLFTVVLNSQPTSDVSIPLVSSDTSEGTVSPGQLTFTRDNWSAPQTVTIKGVDDPRADGNQPYRIITQGAISDDPNYNGMNPANVDVTNIDDDSPGITVRPANQTLSTSEKGETATFSVVLNSQPVATVDIGVSSSNGAEGTVTPGSLRFTPDNWNAPQTVTIKGVNDDVADGPQPYRIALAAAQSDDVNYNGRDANDVNVLNIDDDTPGIRVINAGMLTTQENGATATFQIVLNSKPTAGVSLMVSSSRPGEGTVSPSQVAFTTTNWSAPQTVTIKGADDDVADGNQTYRVVLGAALSNDAKYNGIDVTDPIVTNLDNDSPGISVVFTPATGLSTTEQGGSATFTVVLLSQPTQDVTVPLHSSNTNEGTLSPASVTFTAANWAAPRTVTITGVDDRVADGTQPYTVLTDAATSKDAKYAGLDAMDVPVRNVDNDSAGITVTDATGNTVESGAGASFTIVLNSEPKQDVSIALSSSDPSEGTISPTLVTFTPLNWSAPQKITIASVDDKVADGTQPYTIDTAPATSKDAGYNGVDARDVSLSNVDDDSAGIMVSAAKGNTSEGGGTTTFSIVLNSQPTADVSIPISSSAMGEGTLSVDSVTFTTTDWGAPKTVTITGANDDVADGNQPYSIVTDPAQSKDASYSGIDASDVNLLNVDDDSAGLEVSETSGTTSEGGANRTFTFTVVLTSKPTASVTVPVTSSDETEGTVSPDSLVFTTVNWASKQTVTVTGVNDEVADGAQPYAAQLGVVTSQDAKYSGLNPPDVAMSNNDDDSAGIDVSKAAGNTNEGGTTTTFTIVLRSKPTAPVTIPLTSSDETEGTITPKQVIFTTDDWNAKQTVTVHGENDDEADGPQPYVVRTGAATSPDGDYNGMNADDVEVTNIDNDLAGITVSPASGPTSEAGGVAGSATFTVKLNSQPKAAVSIPIQSSATDEGTLDVPSIDFTTSNWASTQTITVHGVNDDIADGAQDYKILLGKPDSTDPAYAAIDPDDVDMTNDDNDSAGVTVSPAAGDISESGTSTTFEIVLKSEPTATVTIPLEVSDDTEAKLEVSSISFTTTNWKTPKQVKVTGVEDNVADGAQDTKVLVGVVTSPDAGYNGKNPPDVDIRTTDNDSASIIVHPPLANLTSEAASAPSVTFGIVLSSAPTAPVTIPLASSMPTEGMITIPASAQLVFDSSNWDVEQFVTVKGVDDDAPDGTVDYVLEIGLSASDDPKYDGKNPTDIQLQNADDDPP
jgi:large repetitive protein